MMTLSGGTTGNSGPFSAVRVTVGAGGGGGVCASRIAMGQRNSKVRKKRIFTMIASLRLRASASKASEVETAVDIQDLAGRVIQQAVGNGPDGFRDVAAFAHAALGEQAAGDLFLVDLFDFGD